ncbi:MAG TPA: enoyl-CoA hydratase/isomerase family protein [Tepidiformaceae bacterium]|nr:enoyl-CoA hydratase/isomerase family protein [Thermoflexaceae bacterium]HMS58362.1 enoyl-CoA hydratase/isomerase family protein [Tepidiformaceae bacterium]
MGIEARYGDVAVEVRPDGVVVLEIQRPPNNFFDAALIGALSDVYEAIDAEPSSRAVVLAAAGKHFCAGANFSAQAAGTAPTARDTSNDLYMQAARLLEAKTPVVAAVHGAAIGGGLGLACSADFRVGCTETRMASNFAQLGFHHGFGLTITLPPIVGQQKALDMLLTGRRLDGEESYRIGLLDRLVAPEEVRAEAIRYASEIASSAPLAVRSIRATMRGNIGERYRAATTHEGKEQAWLRGTEDFREGIRASAERRAPNFQGR